MSKKPATAAPAQSAHESLDASELEYHKAILEDLKNAQLVVNAWGNHLSRKYRLNPKDNLTLDGVIVRADSNEEVPS